MISARLKRITGASLASVLVMGGISVAVAAPASAADFGVTSIDPSGATYLGWHHEKPVGDSSVQWDGLHLGRGGFDNYVLNGLVAAGAPGVATTAADLSLLIQDASITGEGDFLLEVPFSIGAVNPPPSGSWGTLYSEFPLGDGVSPTLTDTFISTKTITGTTIVQDVPQSLAAITTQLALVTDLKYSGFGVFAAAQSPEAVVSSMTWDGDSYYFYRDFGYVPASSSVTVPSSEIRPNEATYPGWHEGYVNAKPAYSVTGGNLHLGDGADSQIINGLATPDTSDLFTLVNSFAIEMVSGDVFMQVPLTFGGANTFATLRPAAGFSANAPGFWQTDLTAEWTSSKAIPATATTDAIAANQSGVLLGDLLEAVSAQTNVRVLAFGVLAQSTVPSVVKSITWNGTTYGFAAVLAATGSDAVNLVFPLGIAGLLVLSGISAVVFTRRQRSVG